MGTEEKHRRVGHGSAPILALERISKRYGTLTALEEREPDGQSR